MGKLMGKLLKKADKEGLFTIKKLKKIKSNVVDKTPATKVAATTKEKVVEKAKEKKLPAQKIAAQTKDNVEQAEKTTKNKKPKMVGLNIYNKTLLS